MSESESKSTKFYIASHNDELYKEDLECDHDKVHDLSDPNELSVSFKDTDSDYGHVLARFNRDKVQIEFKSTNELITIEYPRNSAPLHVNISEHLNTILCFNGSEYYQSNEVYGNTIHVIFTDHILRLHIEHNRIRDCQIDNSNPILLTSDGTSTIVQSSFETFIPDGAVKTDERGVKTDELGINQCLNVFLAFGGNNIVFCSLNLYLVDDPVSFSQTEINFFIKLPEISDFGISAKGSTVMMSIRLLGEKSTHFYLQIYDEEDDDEEDDDRIFILHNFNRRILAKKDQLEQFESLGFQIKAIIDCDEDCDDDVKRFMEDLLKLNCDEDCDDDVRIFMEGFC